MENITVSFRISLPHASNFGYFFEFTNNLATLTKKILQNTTLERWKTPYIVEFKLKWLNYESIRKFSIFLYAIKYYNRKKTLSVTPLQVPGKQTETFEIKTARKEYFNEL